jgi:hypothetical protein
MDWSFKCNRRGGKAAPFAIMVSRAPGPVEGFGKGDPYNSGTGCKMQGGVSVGIMKCAACEFGMVGDTRKGRGSGCYF